jgi:hypothetical protein
VPTIATSIGSRARWNKTASSIAAEAVTATLVLSPAAD